MIDICIPYKKDHNDGLELRFALRSIEKYLTGYNQIHLLTNEPPEWATMMNLIPVDDYPNRKQFSLFKKLWFVMSLTDWVSNRFGYWHDDHFLLKQLHVNEIKPWYHGTLSEALGKANGKYHTAVKNTIEALSYQSNPIRNFDIHVPCIFEKEKIKELQKLDWNKEFIIKSSYFNDSEGEEMTDCKINIPMTKEGIEERIKDRLFFSVGPNGLKMQMIKKLNELYPDKSKYEL